MRSEPAPLGVEDSRGKGSRRKRSAGTALALSLVLLVAIVVTLVLDSRPPPLPRFVPRLVPTDIRFFADPRGESATWVQGHPHDRRTALISRRITAQPQGVWFTGGDPGSTHDEVARTATEASARHELPILVMYAIPHRDCAEQSAGGALDVNEYRRWVDGFSAGLGSFPAWVIVEPDAAMQAGCLTVKQRAERFHALRYAAGTLQRRNPSARIYYDAGNSAWHSAADTASLLMQADVNRYADGIALNVANFNDSNDEVRFGKSVIRYLRNPGLRMVIDTSRNGDGRYAGHAPCAPPGSALGVPPTSRTGDAWVDGFLWVKPPGQSDGCHAAPGTFLPGEAYRLAAD